MKRKNKRIVLYSLLALLILLISLPFVFSTTGPFGEYMLYRKVKNGYFSYANDYLEKYPSGNYSEKVKLLRSAAEFKSAKRTAMGTVGRDEWDNCEKIFEFIKNRKDAPEYTEALNIAEEYGYLNYKELKDWGKIFMYMEEFPDSKYTEEFTKLKEESANNALQGLEEKVQKGKITRSQTEFARYLINEIKTTNKQPKIVVVFEPHLYIKDPYTYKSDFSPAHLNEAFKTNITYNLQKYFPGKNFITFDTILDEASMTFHLKYTIENIYSSDQKPLTGQYFHERYKTTTVNETKEVSEWNAVQKRYVNRTVTESKIVTDYNSIPTYEHAGFFYYLQFLFDCEITYKESGYKHQITHGYRFDEKAAIGEKQTNTVYEKMTDAAVFELTEMILPRVYEN